jgi:hypothetical protein
VCGAARLTGQEPAQGGRNARRLLDDLPVGEANNLEAHQLEPNVAGPVLLESELATVGGPAVRLHHQPTPAPEEMDHERANPGIHLRLR